MGHMSADQPKITLKVGQSLGATPPNEGYMPVINGASFDVVAFYSNLSQAEIADWQQGSARYGVFIQHSLPLFILDLGSTWGLDVYLNIIHEDQGTRKHFFEGDPQHTKVNLILVSYPDAVVRSIRTIAIEPDKMRWIKEACFNQPSRYASAEECGQAAEELLDRFDSQVLRKMAKIA